MVDHEMEMAVEKVEAMFRKADSNIEYLSRKLNDDFRQSLDGDDPELSPLEMKRHLQEVKKELSSLQEDAGAIRTAQEEMIDQFKGQLRAVSQAVQGLQTTAGVELDDAKDQEAIIEALLGIKLSNSDHQPAVQEGNPLSPIETPTSQGAEVATPGTPESVLNGNKENETPPHERRLASPVFYPVQESEFLSVSEIIRGRATLAEVNRAYRKLYDHFQAEPNSAPLMTRDMVSMGMRITGATGQAKLKILRSLKIVTITSKGDVKLI